MLIFCFQLLGFMYSWLTFYHQGHEVAKDFKPHMTELQSRIQNTREHFNASREDIHALMRKMLEVRQSVSRVPVKKLSNELKRFYDSQ